MCCNILIVKDVGDFSIYLCPLGVESASSELIVSSSRADSDTEQESNSAPKKKKKKHKSKDRERDKVFI